MTAHTVLRLAIATGLIWPSLVVAQDEIRGGDVRVVIDGKYALTTEGYAQYRKCIADTPLGGSMETYNTALSVCREKAKETAFIIPPRDSAVKNEPGNTSANTMDIRDKAVNLDRAWQLQIIKK